MNPEIPEPSDPLDPVGQDTSIDSRYRSPLESEGEAEVVVAELVPPSPPVNSLRIYFAWLVIIGVTVGMFWMVSASRQAMGEEKVADKASMMQTGIGAKWMVGVREMLEQANATDSLPEDEYNADQFNSGSLEQRYGAVLLENELVDAAAAKEMLAEIDVLVAEEKYEPTDNQKRLRKIVDQLLDQYLIEQWDSSTVRKKDRDFLTDQMGWVGALGLVPENSPDTVGRQDLIDEAFNTVIKLICFLLAGIAALIGGLVAAVIFVVKLNQRAIVGNFSTLKERSHLYLETFAIWMVLFVVLQIGVAIVSPMLPLKGALASMLISLVIFFGSLVALVWPLFNGVPFSTVRKDIGWTVGNPFKEIGAGIVGYVSMLPVMVVVMIGVLIIVGVVAGISGGGGGSEFAPIGGDGHPIQQEIASGETMAWIGVVLLACVAAPIVEETVFRGVLYRYLRDSSGKRWARAASVLFACVVNGFIFAAIHPQGIIGIPILMTLAIGMSLAREWRDSLIAPMTMHAINNSMVTCLMFAIF